MFNSVATHTIPTKTLYKRQDHEADATTSTPSSSSSQLPSSTSTDSSDESAWFGNNWAWQRWSIFAIFILVILFAVIGTIRANAARARRGRRPITGTSWFTPPSYLQSERQYNYDDGTRVDRRNRDNNGANGEEYVPQYTEEVNPDDMGYYDDKGLFHVNSKALPLPPPPELDQNLSGADAHGNSHGFTGSGLIRDGYDYYNNSRLNASQNGTGDSHNVSEQLESLSLTSPENAMIRQRAREQYYSLGGTSAANSGSGTSNSNSGLANGNSLARESIEMARISNAVNDNNGSNNADELVHNDNSNNNRRPRLSVQEQVVQARNLQHKGHV
ncbi:hypothetical protein ACO0QE_001467 [Hanseniaspora vineae]